MFLHPLFELGRFEVVARSVCWISCSIFYSHFYRYADFYSNITCEQFSQRATSVHDVLVFGFRKIRDQS